MSRKARPSDLEKIGFTHTKAGGASIPGREKNTCGEGAEAGELAMLGSSVCCGVWRDRQGPDNVELFRPKVPEE